MLAAAKAQLSPVDVQRIISDTRALKAAQAAHDTAAQLATIPSLQLADLNPHQLELPTEITEASPEGCRHTALLFFFPGAQKQTGKEKELSSAGL